MNQLELNTIAQHFIRSQSIEVMKKLKTILFDDLKERVKHMPGPTVHYIHNTALFDTLLVINSILANGNRSVQAVREYEEYAQTLRPKFLDIVDSLKDFRPTNDVGDNGSSDSTDE